MTESRSHRIVWLLEELGVQYELKLYKRTKEFRAPPELKKVHPLGKSPLVEIIRPNRPHLVLAETGHIMQYLVQNYDHSKKFIARNPDEQEQIDYFLHFSEGTLQPLLVALLIGLFARKQAPFGTKYFVRLVIGQINRAYYSTELVNALDYLEQYAKGKGGKYILGDKLTPADIILSFPVAENIFAQPERANAILADHIDFGKRYPTLSEWSKDILKEPKYVKSGEIIEQKMKELGWN